MGTFIKIIILLVFIIVAAATALPFFFDPNDHKQAITEQIEKATGRTLTLTGEINLSVFPWLVIELGAFTLSNREGFNAKHFAQAAKAEVRIKLLPLLKKQLLMDKIIIDGLTVNLEKNQAGETNWGDLVADKPKAEQSTNNPNNSSHAVANFNIAGLKLTNANISWTDNTRLQQYQLTKVNLTSDALLPAKPATVNMAFDISHAKSNTIAHINLAADIMLDLTQHTLTIPQLAIKINDLLINGNIKASKLSAKTPDIAGNLTINPVNLRQLAEQLDFALPVIADPTTLTHIQLTTDFSGSSTAINAKNLQLALDQSTLSGELAMTNFADPSFTFELLLDQIDADRYLGAPSTAEKPTPAVTTSPSKTTSEQTLPLTMLRAINAKGNIGIGKLTINGIHSEKIELAIDANNGLVKLAPLSAKLYQGQYQGDIKLNANEETLSLTINKQLTGIEIAPLLTDLTGDDTVSGTVNAQAKLTAHGNTIEQLKASISGEGQFAFTEGSLTGINIGEAIRKAKAALAEKPFLSKAAIKTDFTSLSGSFVANNGNITNHDLLVKSPLLHMTGTGSIDLAKQAINYHLNTTIINSDNDEALNDLKGLTIPVNISGSFANPKAGVNLAKLVKDNASEKIKSKVAEKLTDKLGLESKTAVQANNTDADKQRQAKSVEEQAKEALKNKLRDLF